MTNPLPSAPVAARKPHSTPIHGTELLDDYAWLRDKGAPEVTAYLEAENAYTSAAMSGTEDLQHTLYTEILSHIQEDDVSVPYRDGAYEYLSRTTKGLQYPRFIRRPISDPTIEQTILDVNQLAEGQPFMSLGALGISPNGKLLAYTTDNTGFRQYTLAIKDLETNQTLADTAQRVGSIVWAADSATLFFTTEDDQTKRQDQLWRHTLGATTADTLVFEEKDERFNLGVGRTRDRKFLLLEAGSHTTSEAWFLSSSTPEAAFTLIAPRVDDEEYSIDHRDGFFYIRSNRDAEQFKLLRTPVATPGRDHWQEILPEHKDAPLEDFDLFQTFLVTNYSERGLPILRVFALDAEGLPSTPNDIRFPDPAYTAYGEINRAFDTTEFRYSYQSLVRPASVFSYNVATQLSTLLKQQEVPGGFDATQYASERLWFKAPDGVEVPISLVYRRDKFHKDAKSPLYVYGYGSYGYALPLGFSA